MTYRAKLAYDTFNETAYPGQPCVEFQHLTDKEQLAWANAAQTVAAEAVKEAVDNIELQDQADMARDEWLADEAQTNSTQL